MSGASQSDAPLDHCDDPACEDCVEPAEAFAIIGNETRLDILKELWAAPERPVRFSNLRRRVGMRDSAQFNYHLGKLTGTFVRKTNDGYEFKSAGRKVVSAILGGSFTGHPNVGPIDLEEDCVVCGDPLQANYTDEQMAVECPECGHGHGKFRFPPGGFHDRTHTAVMRAFNERVRHLHCLAADGVCPECNGKMITEIVDKPVESLGTDFHVVHRCQQCRHELRSPIGLVLLDTADVVTFYRDHGIDLCRIPYWSLSWAITDEHLVVHSRDPWRLEIAITLDDETLTVTLDGDLALLDRERTTGTEAATAEAA